MGNADMKRFIEGESRDQVTLLPECLDDYIGEDNPVRVIDLFVDELDMTSLGFDGAAPAATWLPSITSSEDIHLRLSESHSIQPAPGAGGATQC